MKRISSILREGRRAGQQRERERESDEMGWGGGGAADAAERLRVGVGASIFPREKEEEEEEIGGGQGPSKQGGGSLTRNGVSRGPLFLPRLCSLFSHSLSLSQSFSLSFSVRVRSFSPSLTSSRGPGRSLSRVKEVRRCPNKRRAPLEKKKRGLGAAG